MLYLLVCCFFSAAYRGTYVDGKWVLDVPNGKFEWKALTDAWNNGEKVEAPFDGLTWEEGFNKVYVDTFHKSITQIATVEGEEFVPVTDFSKWNGLRTFAQARKCSELFWKFYPYIYKRLANGGSPTFIRLEFGTSGVAWTSGNLVSVNQEYANSGYSSISAKTYYFGEISYLINKYDVRNVIKSRNN